MGLLRRSFVIVTTVFLVMLFVKLRDYQAQSIRFGIKSVVVEPGQSLAATQALGLDNDSTQREPNNIRGVFTESLKLHYINVTAKGRFANHLFQVASMIGIAEHIGYTPIITKENKIHPAFDIPNMYDSDWRPQNVQFFEEKNSGCFDRDTYSLSTTSNWTLDGYYQSWKYFEKIPRLIRNLFKFKTTILHKAQNILRRIRLKNETLIGVHVRRGDMTHHSAYVHGFEVAPVSYLINAINYFRNRYANPIFVVVSNDRKWCIENIKFSDVIIAVDNDMYVDMALLSECNHTIMTLGSFSWWGAWLAGGDVVYYSRYPRPGSRLEKEFNRSDYYPSHWISLS